MKSHRRLFAAASAAALVMAAGLPQIAVLAQFVKDLSFENPGVGQPASQAKPAIQVGIDVQVRPVGPEQFEVGLRAIGHGPGFAVQLARVKTQGHVGLARVAQATAQHPAAHGLAVGQLGQPLGLLRGAGVCLNGWRGEINRR